MKNSLVSEVASLFSRKGFQVVSCDGMQSSFDVLAKSEDTLFLVKVLSNIEGLTPEKSNELKKVSSILDATPLIVGERIKSTNLELGVLYERYGLHVVSPKTLKNLLVDEAPKTYAIRGNYCVRLNPKRLAQIRSDSGLTQDALAKCLGVSKQSVYRYERDGRVSSFIARNIVEFFGEDEDLFLASDLFNPDFSGGDFEFHGYVSDMKRQALEFFREIGFEASLTKAPFDIVLKDEEMIFTAVSNDWRRLRHRIEILEDISDTVGGLEVCITERTKSVGGSVLKPEDLSGFKTCREFIQMLS